jgi:hypothetical protein
MGLMDLFRPKWKHSKREVREAAAQSLTDQSILREIAKTDEAFGIRLFAVEKLTNQAPLAEIAKTEKKPSVRKAAVNKLDDQALLVEIAGTERNHDVCRAAVERVTDQKAIFAILRQKVAGTIRRWPNGSKQDGRSPNDAVCSPATSFVKESLATLPRTRVFA